MKTGIYWQDPKYALKPGRDFIFDPSLVLYLPLGKLDGASFISKDAYGHLCTVTGALWRPSGRYFDGSDDVITIPHTSSLAITDVLTCLFWLKTTRETHGVLISKHYREYNIDILEPTTRIEVMYGDGSNYTTVELNNTPDIWDSNFHHVAVIIRKDGSGVDSIVDGNFIESVAASDVTGSGTTDLRIGKRTDGAYAFKGTMGEIAVYNRALTPLEIQHNYLATKWRYR